MDTLLIVLAVIYFLFVLLGWAKAAITYPLHRSPSTFWRAIFIPAYYIGVYFLTLVVLLSVGRCTAKALREDLL